MLFLKFIFILTLTYLGILVKKAGHCLFHKMAMLQ